MGDNSKISAAPPVVSNNLAVLRAIASELEASRQCLEQLGVALCCDPNLVQAHLSTLQGLDELAQRQACLANVLRATDMQAALADISLEALRERMTAEIAG